jgi:hypothetical protein
MDPLVSLRSPQNNREEECLSAGDEEEFQNDTEESKDNDEGV